MIKRIQILKKITKELERVTTDLHNINAAWIVTGTIAWARLIANFPRTIAELLSDHDKPTHDALGIDADTVDGDHKADLESTMDSKITAHDVNTGVHGVGSNYVCQAPTSGHLVRSFTKGWTVNKLLKGAGVGADPSEIADPTISTQNVVTSSRSLGTVYQNTTGKPLHVFITLGCAANLYNYACATAYCDSNSSPTTVVGRAGFSTVAGAAVGAFFMLNFIVLPGYYYKVVDSGTIGVSLLQWVEYN